MSNEAQPVNADGGSADDDAIDAGPPVFSEPDAAAAYQELLGEAQALPEREVVPYRLDPDLALVNVKTSDQVLAVHGAAVPEHLPKVDLPALERLGKLALATKYSAMLVDRTTVSERTISQKIVEARGYRNTLLPIMAGLAATGHVSQVAYQDILRGRGPRDVAEDCVTLAQVFRENAAALAGKHSATPEMIENAAVVGSFLLQHVRPANAPVQKAAPPSAAVDVRDRFATLLTRRYATLQVVAYYFHGESYEDVAPPLMSRQVQRAKKEEPKAAPVEEGAPA